MIEFTFHMSRKVYNDTKETRDYRRGDYDSIKKCLSLIDWDIFLNGDTITSVKERNGDIKNARW